jgi:hypothetical protein
MFKRGYFLNSIEKDLIKDYSKEDQIFLEEIYTRQFIENFIYGSSFTEALLKLMLKRSLFLFNNLFTILN